MKFTKIKSLIAVAICTTTLLSISNIGLAAKKDNEKSTNPPPLEYISEADVDFTSIINSGIPLHSEENIFVSDAPEVGIAWAKEAHDQMANRALTILKNDKGTTVYNMLNEMVPYPPGGYTNGGFIACVRAWQADERENDSNTYAGHFYGADGKNYLGQTSPTAYTRFNNHYYNAVTLYNSGKKYEGYEELGMAIHYLQDLNAPHHAANQIAVLSNHTDYEAWVDSNISTFLINNATSTTYDYVMNSTFKKMADDFSASARATYSNCSNSDFRTIGFNDTKENLARTQRAIAGLFYRFLKNTNRI